MTEEMIKAKYEELYSQAKKIFDDNDICGFKKNNGLCQRQVKEKNGKERNPYCCCGSGGYCPEGSDHCEYFKVGVGCSVHSLMCKVWTCPSCSFDNKHHKELKDISFEASLYGFSYPRGTYEDAIKHESKKHKELLKAKSFEEYRNLHREDLHWGY